MKKINIYFILFVVILLFTVQSKGCMVSDDTLWVKINSINWETEEPEIDYQVMESHTLFTFIGNGTFNNPFPEEFRVVHSDGCGWKSSVKYYPNESIQDPLVGTDYYPMACDLALTPVDYPTGKTSFVIFGGIMFPGNLNTLPLGFYDITIDISPAENKEISSINYLISAEGEKMVLRQDSYCGSHSTDETKPSQISNGSDTSEESLNVNLEFYLLPTLIGIFILASSKKNFIK